MNRIACVVLGVLLSIAAASFAASPGGFPSRPNFQSVTIGRKAVRPVVTCTTVCDIASLPVGGRAIIKKTVNTDRASTATSAADPDLQFTNAPLGEYSYTVFLWPSLLGGGFRWRITAPSNDSLGLIQRECAVGTYGTVRQNGTVDQTCADTVIAGFWGGGRIGTAGGTISIDWAQNSSNVSATRLGSAIFIVDRVQ